MTELCHCGRPLHYNDLVIRRIVEAMNDEFGEYVTVVHVDGRRWKVPRHCIALHGLKGRDVDSLGFEECRV